MPPGVCQIDFDSLSLATATLIYGSCRIWESRVEAEADAPKYWTFFQAALDALYNENMTGDDHLKQSLVQPELCCVHWLLAVAAYCWQALHERDPIEQWKMIAKAAFHYALTLNLLADSKAHVKNEISKLQTARADKAHSHNRDRKASALAWFLEQTGMSKNVAAPQISATFKVTEDQARTWLKGDVSSSLEELRRGGANVIAPWCERGRTIGS